MKILIIAHAMGAGGGRVICTNQLQVLRRIDSRDEFFAIVPDQPEYRELNLIDNRFKVAFYRQRFGYLGRVLFDAFALRRMIRRFNPDVIWAMGGLGLRRPPCLQVVSIQNPYVMYSTARIGHLTLKDRVWLFFFRRAFRRQLPTTQLVICQTRVMAERLRAVYGYKGRTIVTGQPVSMFVADFNGRIPALLEHHRDRFKLLYVTRYYPHKGLEILVETMDRYRVELSGVTVFITIEREERPNAKRLLAKIAECGLQDRVVNLGRLKPQELAVHYRHCQALIMPTRLESFSGAYIEAMKFELPILTSDLDFAHEVCGGAALYFDPWDPGSIRDAILKLKSNSEISQQLRVAGLARLGKMSQSWESLIRKILDNLSRLIEGSRVAAGEIRAPDHPLIQR